MQNLLSYLFDFPLKQKIEKLSSLLSSSLLFSIFGSYRKTNKWNSQLVFVIYLAKMNNLMNKWYTDQDRTYYFFLLFFFRTSNTKRVILLQPFSKFFLTCRIFTVNVLTFNFILSCVQRKSRKRMCMLAMVLSLVFIILIIIIWQAIKWTENHRPLEKTFVFMSGCVCMCVCKTDISVCRFSHDKGMIRSDTPVTQCGGK